MKIRYYLLLVVGVMTTLLFLSSFVVEGLLLKDRITTMRAKSLAKVEEQIEKRRSYLVTYVEEALAKKLAQIDSVLEAISSYKTLSDWFAPTEEHLEKGTWHSSASLIQQDEWIHFVQNTAGPKLLSLIIPEQGPFFKIRAETIEEGLAWIYVLGTNSFPLPFLGIQVPLKSADHGDEKVFNADPVDQAYFIYSLERLRNVDLESEASVDHAMLQVPLPSSADVDETRFCDLFAKAVEFAKKQSLPKLSIEWSEIFFAEKDTKELSFKEKTEEYLQEKLQYSSELFLLWQATLLQQAGVFGEGTTGASWPDAITFATGRQGESRICFLEPILNFSAPVFDDEAFFAKYPPKEGSFVSSGSRVVQSPTQNQAFLVNTASVSLGEKRRGLLTVGFDLYGLLEDVVANFNQYGFVVSGGKVVINRPFPGAPMIPSDVLEKAIQDKLNMQGGSFIAGGRKFYFSKIAPDPALDMSFFLLEREDGPSLVFQRVQEEITTKLQQFVMQRNVVELLSLIILWLLLLYASKRITRPIVALASCFSLVKEEEWDQINLPQMEFKKDNEIKKLYDAFFEMIKGLKEKEKVTAILNKVVSEEVAKEILKGEVKLGGEERTVTILFADIRGFTHLTQNMPPHEVICFLNKCMTKLSSSIESHQGVIDKYMGDGVMAIYGAPIAFEESSLHAIISGLEAMAQLARWNLERKEAELPLVHVGIGIHTGPVCAGNMGAKHRLNYTVIGSNVNMASRLCSSALESEVLITEATYLEEGVKERIEVEDKGKMTFKGFDEPVQVYRVLRLKEGVPS
jgi:class 3 adenylate cyclase